MFLIHRGSGFIVPAIPVLFGGAGGIFFGEFGSSPFFGVAGGLVVAAAVTWYLGTILERRAEAAALHLVDPKTNMQYVSKKKHDFFFIPVKWCSVPIALLALFVLFVAMTDSRRATADRTTLTTSR